DPEVGRDRKLLVTSWDRRIDPPALGLFSVTTDPQGRFAIPEVPVGELSVHGMPPAGSPWFLQSASALNVEPGHTTRVEVKAIKGVRLKGTVRQRGTGVPIAGAKVYPYSTAGSDDAAVRTDPEGRFALVARSGPPPHIMVSPPQGFASLMYGLDLPK